MRKITAHYIFTNVSKPLKFGILHFDETGKIIRVIDTHGKLTEEENLEFYSGIICPGFINTHCHLELSHLQNKIPENTGLINFIQEVGAHRMLFSEKEIQQKMEIANTEMIKNGIVAVGDISNSQDSLHIKTVSGLYYQTFIELLGIDQEKAAEIYVKSKLLMNEFQKNNLVCTLTPHSSYSISPLLFQKISDHLNLNNEIITIHNQESKDENELFQGKKNKLFKFLKKVSQNSTNKIFAEQLAKSSIQSVFKYISSAKKILLIHNLYTSEDDIQFLRDYFNKIYWVLCPNSNLYIEKKLPPINLIRKYSEQIAIGTDSLASNQKLSVLEELKTISEYFPDIPFSELLKWGTINGAKALDIDNKYGTFEVGKTPGINLINKINLKKMKLFSDSEVVNFI